MKQYKPFNHRIVIDTKDLLVEPGDNVLHGDLAITKVSLEHLPSNFSSLQDAPEGVLAEGEHSNHAHQLFYDMEPAFIAAQRHLKAVPTETSAGTFSLKRTENGEMFLLIENEPVLLKHQEHNAYRLYPGVYHVGFQIETDHFANLRRQVAD